MIVIAPPDKTMLLCCGATQQGIALLESHPQGTQGGLIAHASYNQIGKFVMFLSQMWYA